MNPRDRLDQAKCPAHKRGPASVPIADRVAAVTRRLQASRRGVVALAAVVIAGCSTVPPGADASGDRRDPRGDVLATVDTPSAPERDAPPAVDVPAGSSDAVGPDVPATGTDAGIDAPIAADGPEAGVDAPAAIDAPDGGPRPTPDASADAPPPPRGVAALPRAIPVVPVGLDARPCTVMVPTGGLQSALTAARGGDVLCITGTHTGSFQVPERRDAGWVVLRSASALPTGRIRPSTAGGLARIVTPDVRAALRFAARAARTLVLGVEITSDPALSPALSPTMLVLVGNGERTVADLPTDIAFDRVYIHGHPAAHVRRAFQLNGGAQTLVNSWCEEIHARGFDSQCVLAFNSPGPLLIENNHLSAASENVNFGGADPSITDMVVADVTIRGNYFFKPSSWVGANWFVKNLLESKAARRVLVEHNVFDGQWLDTQVGHAAIVLKSTNQEGTGTGSQTADWTVRRNLFRNIANWLSIAGRADSGPGRTTVATNERIYVAENWVDSVHVAPFVYPLRPIIVFTSDNVDVVIESNVVASAGPACEGAIFLDVGGRPAVTNLTVRNNVLPTGRSGMYAPSIPRADLAWAAGALGTSTWANAAFLGMGRNYPPGTTFHPTLAAALAVAGVPRTLVSTAVAGAEVPR